MTDRLIKITTALAAVAVAVVAAVISYQHAYELVRSRGESGVTARLLPFTVDGLIWAASMVVLDASRRNQPVPRLAAGGLGAGIVATVGANLAHGIGHGPVGALVSAWAALALVGSFELLMMLIRIGRGSRAGDAGPVPQYQPAPPLAQEALLELSAAPTLEQTIRAWHDAGHSQRSIARKLNIDRRKVKRILDLRHDSADRPGAHSARACTPDLVRSLSAVSVRLAISLWPPVDRHRPSRSARVRRVMPRTGHQVWTISAGRVTSATLPGKRFIGRSARPVPHLKTGGTSGFV